MVGLVVVPFDGNIWGYIRKKAKNIEWLKLRGKHIAYNIHSFDLLVEFFQWMGNNFIEAQNDVILDLYVSSVVIVIDNWPFW